MTRYTIPARAAAAALGTLLAVGSLSACGGESKKPSIAAIDLRPEAVESVTFVAQGLSATLRADSGSWLPGSGATVQAATMMGTSTDKFFPLNTYRILEGEDQSRPEYGFGADNASVKECVPLCSMTVVTTAGRTLKLTVGKQTFNGGFYAKLDGDPRIFLITKDTVAGIVSEAVGKDFAFAASNQIRKIDRVLANENEDGSKKGDQPDYDPYLRQVLAAEQAKAAEKDGKDGSAILVRAAASTQDQPGAKEGKDAQGNSDALNPTGASQ